MKTSSGKARAPARKKAPAKKKARAAAAASGEDPRFLAVLDAFAAEPGLRAIVDAYLASRDRPRREFGSNALKVKGKIFAMVSRGRLVVKLPGKRVDELVDSGAGEYFDPGHGRLMKQWLSVTSAKASWIDLAREAHGFASGAPSRP